MFTLFMTHKVHDHESSTPLKPGFVFWFCAMEYSNEPLWSWWLSLPGRFRCWWPHRPSWSPVLQWEGGRPRRLWPESKLRPRLSSYRQSQRHSYPHPEEKLSDRDICMVAFKIRALMEFEIHKRSRLDFMRLAIHIVNKRGNLNLRPPKDLNFLWNWKYALVFTMSVTCISKCILKV